MDLGEGAEHGSTASRPITACCHKAIDVRHAAASFPGHTEWNKWPAATPAAGSPVKLAGKCNTTMTIAPPMY